MIAHMIEQNTSKDLFTQYRNACDSPTTAGHIIIGFAKNNCPYYALSKTLIIRKLVGV